MTRLLVSVRDADEARAALDGGAAIIDVKEPRHGSLGAADPRQWRAVQQVVGQARPLSAALGELEQAEQIIQCPDALDALRCYDFAKVGLAGATTEQDSNSLWPVRWARILEALPPNVGRVAVVYADYRRAAAPSPEQIIDQAARLQCRFVLFDTFDKRAGNLFDALSDNQLQRYVSQVRQLGLPVVLAGSLRADDIARARSLQPDVLAVRGAVCRGSRSEQVDITLVESFASQLLACDATE